MNRTPEVLIVGAGPAGLAAAARLARLGIDDVLVVDREAEAGGIPRFCPHPTFGLTDFFRPLTGPAYAANWRRRVAPDRIATRTSVTHIGRNGDVTASTPEGVVVISPRRVLLATGIRETPRAARLVSGDRPRNVLTTGALQRLAASGEPLPFHRPIVVGTELVAFSAVLSLREHGANPVAMLEAGSRIVARRPGDTIARTLLQTPVLCNHRVVSVNSAPDDTARLESISVETPSGRREIACDAVVFTGAFVPEASLLGSFPELVSPGSRGPVVDQNWRTDNPQIYAAGNVLRAVETAAWSAREGTAAAEAIAADIRGHVPNRRIPIATEGPVGLVVPGAISVPVGVLGPLHMQVRMHADARGCFVLRMDGTEFWRSRVTDARRERRYSVTRQLPPLDRAEHLTLGFIKA